MRIDLSAPVNTFELSMLGVLIVFGDLVQLRTQKRSIVQDHGSPRAVFVPCMTVRAS